MNVNRRRLLVVPRELVPTDVELTMLASLKEYGGVCGNTSSAVTKRIRSLLMGNGVLVGDDKPLFSATKRKVLTSTGTKKGDLFLADVNTQLKNKNITTDIKVDTSSNLFTTITIDEPTPGLKEILGFRVPDQRSGKLELQYMHEYAGLSSSIGLTANPIVNFSGVVWNNNLALGSDFSFDTKEGAFTKCNFGSSFTNADLIAALTV